MSQSLTKTQQNRTRKRNSILATVWSVVSLGGLALLLFGTTPDRIGPLGITLFFILVFAALFSLGMLIRIRIFRSPGSSSLLFAILVSAAITGALAINTIELQIGDVVLLAVFVVTFSIYWSRLRQ